MNINKIERYKEMLENDFILDMNEEDVYNFLYAGLYHNEGIMSEGLRDRATTDCLLKLFILNSDYKTLEKVMQALNVTEDEVTKYIEEN